MSTIMGYKNLCDFHTHTTYSMHGMSSPSEMVDAAIEEGLEYIAITDHFYPYDQSADSYEYKNQKVRLKCICTYFESLKDKIVVVSGWEYNMFAHDDYDNYDIFNTIINDINKYHRFDIIGYHDWFAPQKNVSLSDMYFELSSRISKRCYNCIAHFEQLLKLLINGVCQGNYHLLDRFIRVVLMDIQNSNVIMEVNENSVKKNKHLAETWITVAKSMRIPIIVNTDSHIKYSVGKVHTSDELLTSVNYPKDLIVNIDKCRISSIIER